MDDSDLPTAAGDRPPEPADEGGAEDEQFAARTERCGALAAAIAGVLGGALREHEQQAAATARSQEELTTVIDRLNGGGLFLISHTLFPRYYTTRCFVAAAFVMWVRCGLGFGCLFSPMHCS